MAYAYRREDRGGTFLAQVFSGCDLRAVEKRKGYRYCQRERGDDGTSEAG
jgi:hypothetical protein